MVYTKKCYHLSIKILKKFSIKVTVQVGPFASTNPLKMESWLSKEIISVLLNRINYVCIVQLPYKWNRDCSVLLEQGLPESNNRIFRFFLDDFS